MMVFGYPEPELVSIWPTHVLTLVGATHGCPIEAMLSESGRAWLDPTGSGNVQVLAESLPELTARR